MSLNKYFKGVIAGSFFKYVLQKHIQTSIIFNRNCGVIRLF